MDLSLGISCFQSYNNRKQQQQQQQQQIQRINVQALMQLRSAEPKQAALNTAASCMLSVTPVVAADIRRNTLCTKSLY
jgi:hypothetical protein